MAVLAGWGFVGTLRAERALQVRRWVARLESVADARKEALGSWMAERRADVEVLAWDPDLIGYCAGKGDSPAAGSSHVRAHLDNLQRFVGVLGAYLFGPGGEVILAGSGAPLPCPATPPMARRAVRERRLLLHDVHTTGQGTPMIGFLAPVFERPDPMERRPDAPVLGVVALYLDPRTTLLPLLRHHGLSPPQVRTYLVRRVPGGLELLGASRDEPVRDLPAAPPGSAVAAAMGAREAGGRFAALDGRPVLGVARWISDAGWGLVVEVDEAAALAGWRHQVLWQSVIGGMVLLCLVLAGVAAWRTWAGNRYRRLLHEIRDREERLQALARGSEDAVFLKDLEGRYLLVNPAAARLLGVPADAAEGRRAEEYLPPGVARELADHDRRVLETGKAFHGEETIQVEGEPRTFLASRIPIRDAGGAIRGVAGVLRDITERKRWEEELAGRARTLDGLYRLASRLTLAPAEDEVLHAVVEGAVTAFRAHTGVLYRLAPDGQGLRLAAGQGLSLARRVRLARIGCDRGLLGLALSREQTLLVEDCPAHPAAIPEELELLEASSLAAVPLRAEGAVLGVLGLGFLEPRGFRDHEKEALEALGHMAGVALERARALGSLRAEAESRRRAEARLRRLHDATAGLTGQPLLRSVVLALSGELGCRWAMLSRVDPQGHTGVPLAAAQEGQSMEVGPFPLEGTPCSEAVRNRTPVTYERGAAERFPGSPLLREAGVEAYLGHPLTDSRGRILGILCAFHDAPLDLGPAEREVLALYARRAAGELERMAAEERLAETRRVLDTLIENLPGAVYRCQARPGRRAVRFLSPAIRAIVGLAPEEITGDPARGLDDWVVPEDRSRVWAEIEAAVAGGRSYEVEYRIHDARGKIRWVYDVGREVRGAGGEPWLEGVLFDHTERRALEAQLTHSQRMEALGRLAGGVAHDFNNLLTAISGYGELLLRRARGDERTRRAAGEILKAADRAADLTHHLLAFSRRQAVEPKVVDLNECIRDLVGMLERVLGEDVRLHLDLAPEPLRVKADPGQMEQVVLNLVVNARDAMPSGGDLWVRAAKGRDEALGEGPGPCAVIEVTDTGTGIPPDVLEHIFEPFFTTKGEDRGTGLGLSTVYGIVKQAGGLVRVETEPGRGTTFRVLWPTLARPGRRCRREEPGPAVRPAGQGRKVALVEDDDAVRVLAAESLRAHGYRVRAFGCAREARAALEQGEGVDVLVTDVVMPGLQGPDLVRGLRERWPGLKVVFISGHAGDHLEGLDLPGTAFLQKPFRLARLHAAVASLLDPGPG